MSVDTEHVLYTKFKSKWERCRDAAEGEDAVKERGTKYLPPLDSHKRESTTIGTNSKYDEYKLRALYYNAVGRTITGLSGAIFQKAISIEIDVPAAKKHIDDITLTDQPLELFALNVTQEFLTTGRCGILVDMSTELATTPRPYWVLYEAENIVNWKFRNLGGDKELCMVVLREIIEEQDDEDEFKIEPVVQYRVLRLSDEGVYTQQVYKDTSENSSSTPGIVKSNATFEEGEIITPQRRGKPLNFIPFALPWALNAPPLLDLVAVNLSHYRGVADLKHGLHYTALPTPWVSGQLGDPSAPLSIGSGKAWSLDKDGKAGMLEFTGQGLGAIREDLLGMQRMMATLGARLLEEPPRYAETAMGVSMRHGSDFASLRMIAQVVEQQISFALKIHCWWLSTNELVAEMKSKIELNKIFYDQAVTADELRALLMLLQEGGISFNTFYERLADTSWMREGISAEEELADIKADGDQFRKVKPGLQQPEPRSNAPGSDPPPKPGS